MHVMKKFFTLAVTVACVRSAAEAAWRWSVWGAWFSRAGQRSLGDYTQSLVSMGLPRHAVVSPRG